MGVSGSGSINLIVGILPLLPFATSFATEWDKRATNFWIVRTGIRNYSINKVVTSALSGALTTGLGIVLFILIAGLWFPLFSNITSGNPYAELLEAGKPLLYLMYYIVHISLGSALFAVTGLWVSTYIPNKFVAISTPMVLYFIAHRFTTQLDIPEYLKALWIVEAIYHAGSPLATLLLKLVIVTILCILMGYGTVPTNTEEGVA